MRAPKPPPQTFGEAVNDFIAALDVSIDRIAPFAALHPQQLRRLGKDAKHRTLQPEAIDKLIAATELIGKSLPDWQKEIWQAHLKTASLYTVLVIAAHRRTKLGWPKTPKDHERVWNTARDLVVHSGGILYAREEGETYQDRSEGFFGDAFWLYRNVWSVNKIEGEADVYAALEELDAKLRDKK